MAVSLTPITFTTYHVCDCCQRRSSMSPTLYAALSSLACVDAALNARKCLTPNIDGFNSGAICLKPAPASASSLVSTRRSTIPASDVRLARNHITGVLEPASVAPSLLERASVAPSVLGRASVAPSVLERASVAPSVLEHVADEDLASEPAGDDPVVGETVVFVPVVWHVVCASEDPVTGACACVVSMLVASATVAGR